MDVPGHEKFFRRIELHLGKQAVDSFRSFEEALVTEDQEYDVIALPEQRRWQPVPRD